MAREREFADYREKETRLRPLSSAFTIVLYTTFVAITYTLSGTYMYMYITRFLNNNIYVMRLYGIYELHVWWLKSSWSSTVHRSTSLPLTVLYGRHREQYGSVALYDTFYCGVWWYAFCVARTERFNIHACIGRRGKSYTHTHVHTRLHTHSTDPELNTFVHSMRLKGRHSMQQPILLLVLLHRQQNL